MKSQPNIDFEFITFVMGPEAEDLPLGELAEYVELPECELPPGLLVVNPDIDWLTPDARIKLSRSSMLVRPLAAKNKEVSNYINTDYMGKLCPSYRIQYKL